MATVAPPRKDQPSTAAPSGSLLPRDDAARRAELKVMKRVATGLLGVAFVVFIAARLFEPRYPWLGFIRATAEASLVGGLADWFAVTALFRRPLGLPIPHTAIIQTQKDRMGQVLANFVQSHFLSREPLTAKLRSMHLSERVASWLSDSEHSTTIARHLAVGVAQAVQTLPEADARDLIRESAMARLQAVQLAPVLGNLLSAVATDDRHQSLLDEALRLVRDALDTNREDLREKIREESPWWVPGIIDDELHRRILAAAHRLIEEVAADRDHPLRLKFDVAFRDFVDRLQHSPKVIARTEELKEDLLGHPMVEEFAATLWDRARRAAAKFSSEGDGAAVQPLARGISALGDSLLENEQRRAELDDFVTDFIATLVEQHRHEVGDLIAQTVRRWDPEMAAQRIELAVGRDLQFIRLNGTLVGGL
ncbi:MAG TPA: DUF445 family protein, partial [Gemmatimonadales bacterium]|nr:DUF445 family protein [Gemmatimonadales bacterium]